MSRLNRSFVVLGLGTFGSTVASELARFGNAVMGIDIKELRVSRLADDLTTALIADARDEEAMREAGVGLYGAMREGTFLPCSSDHPLNAGDKLLLLGKRPDLRAFGDSLR